MKKKSSNALKADRAIDRVTFHPNRASPSEVLRVPVPKLGDGVVLVPGSLSLIFDLAVSGHANDYIVNNVARAHVYRLTVKFAGEIAQDTDGYDLFKLCEDLFLTKNERASMFREGIQSVDLSKIRAMWKIRRNRKASLLGTFNCHCTGKCVSENSKGFIKIKKNFFFLTLILLQCCVFKRKSSDLCSFGETFARVCLG